MATATTSADPTKSRAFNSGAKAIRDTGKPENQLQIPFNLLMAKLPSPLSPLVTLSPRRPVRYKITASRKTLRLWGLSP